MTVTDKICASFYGELSLKCYVWALKALICAKTGNYFYSDKKLSQK